jgi:hypothetical protein
LRGTVPRSAARSAAASGGWKLCSMRCGALPLLSKGGNSHRVRQAASPSTSIPSETACAKPVPEEPPGNHAAADAREESLDCGSPLPLSAMQPAASGATEGLIRLSPCQCHRARSRAALPRATAGCSSPGCFPHVFDEINLAESLIPADHRQARFLPVLHPQSQI